MIKEMIKGMPLVIKAIRLADEKHKGQCRNGSGHEYIAHPLAVSYCLSRYKKSGMLAEIISIAILHDTIEDTDLTYEEIEKEFGKIIADTVFELTNDRIESKKLGKEEYLKKKLVNLSSYALYIKLADMYCNILDKPKPETVQRIRNICTFLITERKVLTENQLRMISEILSMRDFEYENN